mgnify:CR=1 FL=1
MSDYHVSTSSRFYFDTYQTDLHIFSFFTVWIGSTNLALSHLLAPFLVALCRRKSARLTAVIGGLVMSLSLLFASFAKQYDQIFLR